MQSNDFKLIGQFKKFLSNCMHHDKIDMGPKQQPLP